jgi:hypothetical protein
MSSTRKTPEHLKSAKNLRGVAEAAGAAGAEAAGAAGAEAAGAAEVVEAALVAEVAALVAEVSALAAEVSALAAEVAEAAAAEDVASSPIP